MNLEFKTPLVNVILLDEELRAVIGNCLDGVSFDGNQVIVHLADDATSDCISKVEPVVNAHNPTKLTAIQQQWATLRENNLAPLDLRLFADADASVGLLAQKVAWLEMEIRASQRE